MNKRCAWPVVAVGEEKKLYPIHDLTTFLMSMLEVPVVQANLCWRSLGLAIARTQADQAIETPLYFSLDRERLLGEISMPTKEPQDVWILAGVALFLKD